MPDAVRSRGWSHDWATAWTAVADELAWQSPAEELYRDGPDGGRWFPGGSLNVAVNCVDRHLGTRADQVAILWEGEPGDRRAITYGELQAEVLALSEALAAVELGPGDRVALHLGWLPETVVAMLACARLGATHVVLPTPLPGDALAERLGQVAPRVLITQDGAWRHGTMLPLKARADEAVAAAASVEQTIVVRRTGVDVAWYEGDRWYHEVIAGPRGGRDRSPLPPAVLASHHPLLATHLPHRRGEASLAIHGGATLLASAVALHRSGLAEPGAGPYWCAVDIAWLAGQVHGVYGPLACGDTAVMFEGMLDAPTRTRAWEIVERYGVSSLTTTPSVLGNLHRWSDSRPRGEQLASLRRIVAAGEPLDASLRTWISEILPADVRIADGWGQIELGGIVVVDPRAGPATCPTGRDIVDPEGRPVAPEAVGELVLRHPWAGEVVRIEGPGAEEMRRRRQRYPDAYATGDRARRRPDGSPSVLGRMDAIVSISGQLVSLAEVRRVLLDHPFVTDAVVAERLDPRTGRALVAAVVVSADERRDDTAVAADIGRAVHESLGGLARPRTIAFLDRVGDELNADERRAGLRSLLATDDDPVLRLEWTQFLAATAAGAATDTPDR
jgi:acetyl-CoA synthetase